MSELSIKPKHRKFVREYLLSYDPEDAAEKSGFARRTGHSLLNNPAIRTMLRRRQAVLDAEATIDQQKVLKRFADIAFADIREILTWETDEFGRTNVMVKDSEDLSPEVVALVKEITIDSDGNAKVKLHDSTAALDKVARHLGMYNDSVGVDFTGELADLLKGAVNNGHELPKPAGRPNVGEPDTGHGLSGPALPTPVTIDGELTTGPVLETE